MGKTILIPTDLKIESLFTLKHALNKNDKVDVILLYSCSLPDSITDLLFYSPERILQPLITKDYREACSVIQNKYSSNIVNLRIKLFHGSGSTAFKHFLAANNVDEIYVAKTYKYRLGSNCIDPLPFIRKSTITVHEADWQQKFNVPEKDQLAELFN